GDKALTNAKEIPATPAYIPVKGAKAMTFEKDGEEIFVSGKDGADINLQDLIAAKIITLPSDGRVIAAGDFTATDDAAKNFFDKVFGKESVIGAKDGEVITARGSNSILEVSTDGENFTKYSSATNLFTFDGTTINLTNSKDFVAETEDDYITVETAKDNSGIKEVITNFVNDYNKLIDELYKITSTSRPKSSGSYYDPLTEEQEEEMSDKEIEKWNENAKQGLLYRDNNVLKFLSEIRGAMLTRVDGMGLNDLGIGGKSWLVDGKISLDQMNGMLSIDESKLDSMLEAYGDQVADLFTGENGLAAKLENVIDKAISTSKLTTKDSSGKRVTKGYGYLSQMAGIEGTRTEKDNLIYKQIEYINKIIENLNKKYENQQERYWKQYSRLESMMAKMQNTMSYFEQ
ncbi:MAG: flagellar filament capping protein FliD, partial [Oscillospiraceae bacterium]|nr:flagellar filament capping protein FliD [Oscillospiraceae bacterium]